VVHTGLGNEEGPRLENNNTKGWPGGVAQVVPRLPSKCEAMSFFGSTTSRRQKSGGSQFEASLDK
jgi:hypothetical protein